MPITSSLPVPSERRVLVIGATGLMGREVVVAVTGGRLDFGPWERIFYGEFDGKRPKRALIKILGE